MKNKEKGIVYKVTNKLNGKIYIGVTTKSIEERKKDHLLKATQGKGSYFQEAIGTYSPGCFIWEQIDTASTTDELAQKEREYILKYDSKSNGYNEDIGGGFKKTIYQYDMSGNLITTYNCLNDIKLSDKRRISNACLNGNIHKGYYWSYSEDNTQLRKVDLRLKKVKQYELSGQLIKEFESVSEASRFTGVSKTGISRCCRREREYAKGFVWRY